MYENAFCMGALSEHPIKFIEMFNHNIQLPTLTHRGAPIAAVNRREDSDFTSMLIDNDLPILFDETAALRL